MLDKIQEALRWALRDISLVPRPFRTIPVTRVGLEPSALARGRPRWISRQAWQVKSGNDWLYSALIQFTQFILSSLG